MHWMGFMTNKMVQKKISELEDTAMENVQNKTEKQLQKRESLSDLWHNFQRQDPPEEKEQYGFSTLPMDSCPITWAGMWSGVTDDIKPIVSAQLVLIK